MSFMLRNVPKWIYSGPKYSRRADAKQTSISLCHPFPLPPFVRRHLCHHAERKSTLRLLGAYLRLHLRVNGPEGSGGVRRDSEGTNFGRGIGPTRVPWWVIGKYPWGRGWEGEEVEIDTRWRSCQTSWRIAVRCLLSPRLPARTY